MAAYKKLMQNTFGANYETHFATALALNSQHASQRLVGRQPLRAMDAIALRLVYLCRVDDENTFKRFVNDKLVSSVADLHEKCRIYDGKTYVVCKSSVETVAAVLDGANKLAQAAPNLKEAVDQLTSYFDAVSGMSRAEFRTFKDAKIVKTMIGRYRGCRVKGALPGQALRL